MAEGELDAPEEPELVPEPEEDPLLESDPDPLPELEVPVLELEEPEAVVVTKPVLVEELLDAVPVPVEDEPEVVAVAISRTKLDTPKQRPEGSSQHVRTLWPAEEQVLE